MGSNPICATMKYEELAIKIIEGIAEEYDFKGHPCCPICGNETCADNEHEKGCQFLKFLKLYRKRNKNAVP